MVGEVEGKIVEAAAHSSLPTSSSSSGGSSTREGCGDLLDGRQATTLRVRLCACAVTLPHSSA